MRTKTLAVMAAVGALGAAYAMADVYSANTVGFVNVVLANNGWHMIANPLNNTNNNLSSIIPSGTVLPDGTSIWTWNATAQSWDQNAIYFGRGGAPGDQAWDPDLVMNPGQGFLIGVPAGDPTAPPPYTLTFVGDVPQNPVGGPPLTTALQANWNMVASQVPQAGEMTIDLKYQIADGDSAWKWNSVSQSWTDFFTGIYAPPDSFWDPPLNLVPGEAVLLGRTAAGAWTRDFQVQ